MSGRPPYRAASRRQARRGHERAPVPAQDVPEPVRELVDRGLAKDLADRPPNAGVLLVELEAAAPLGYGENWAERGRSQLARRAALAGLLPVAASSRLDLRPGVDHELRRRRVAGVLAASAVLLLVGGLVTAGQLGGAPGTTAAGPAGAAATQAGPADPPASGPGGTGPVPPVGADPRPGPPAVGAPRAGDAVPAALAADPATPQRPAPAARPPLRPVGARSGRWFVGGPAD